MEILNKTVLVTGATGLIGSNLVEKLRHKDYDNIDCEFEEFCNMYNEICDTIMEVYDE